MLLILRYLSITVLHFRLCSLEFKDSSKKAPRYLIQCYDSILLPQVSIWGVRGRVVSLRNVGGSTQVTVRAWNNARKGTWGFSPPVKLERRHMTFTVSVWPKTQSNKKKQQILISFVLHFSSCWQLLFQ
jgi:hypothetical protein